MKVNAPLMRMRRVPPSTTLDHPFPHSPIPQPRRFDTPPIPHSTPLHELESIEVDYDRASRQEAHQEPHQGAFGFGSEPIQRVRGGGNDGDKEDDKKKKRRTDDRKRNTGDKKEKKKKETRDSRDRVQDRKKKKPIIKIKKEEPEESNKRKRESDSDDSSNKSDPTRRKMKREGSKGEPKRKPVGKKIVKKKEKDDDDGNWDPRDYDQRTGKRRKTRSKKTETLNDIFDELKTSRTMTLPKKHDFYHEFFAREDTGQLLQTLSDEAMKEYEKMLTGMVTSKKIEEQSKYIGQSLHKSTLDEPEKYYDTEFDQHALSLRELKNHVRTPQVIDKKKKTKEKLSQQESSTPWRQPVPSVRYQPKGSLVTSYDSGDDYNSITSKLKSGVSSKEITPMEIGISLNQPTPKKVREKLEEVEPLKNKRRTKRDNYRKEEEMPSTMNYLYNLAYTDRAVEQKRNRSVGPYQGVRNTLVSNKAFSMEDAFGKHGRGGMVTYVGSGTNSKKTKRQSEQLIGLSMSNIEHENLRHTNLGTKSRRMSGTNRNLKHRAHSARNLAKAVGKKKGMELREGTPEPPSLNEAKKEFKLNLMRDYGSINNRDVVEKKGKYSIEEGGREDSFSEEDTKQETKVEKKKEIKKKREKK